MKTTYFAQVVDSWDEELDILGPFDTMQQAWDAAQDKWNGDDNMANIWILPRAAAVEI